MSAGGFLQKLKQNIQKESMEKIYAGVAKLLYEELGNTVSEQLIAEVLLRLKQQNENTNTL